VFYNEVRCKKQKTYTISYVFMIEWKMHRRGFKARPFVTYRGTATHHSKISPSPLASRPPSSSYTPSLSRWRVGRRPVAEALVCPLSEDGAQSGGQQQDGGSQLSEAGAVAKVIEARTGLDDNL